MVSCAVRPQLTTQLDARARLSTLLAVLRARGRRLGHLLEHVAAPKPPNRDLDAHVRADDQVEERVQLRARQWEQGSERGREEVRAGGKRRGWGGDATRMM